MARNAVSSTNKRANKRATARNAAVTFAPASGRVVLAGARICFEPSAYDGSETAKRSIVLEATDDIKATVQEWERGIDPVKLLSANTAHGIKAKMDPIGVRCWQNKQLVPLPGNLKGNTCNTILEVESETPRTRADSTWRAKISRSFPAAATYPT